MTNNLEQFQTRKNKYYRFESVLAGLTATVLLFVSSAGYAQQMQSNAPEEEFQQGIRLYEEGLFRKSAEVLQEYASNAPDRSLAQTAAYYRTKALGNIDSSLTSYYYRDFIQRYPNTRLSVQLLTEMGHRSFARGSYQDAIEYYQQAADNKAKDAKREKLYYWIAEAAAEDGQNDFAREYYKKLADRLPESEWAPKALYARGRLYLNENNYGASTEAFELLSDRYPNHDMTRRIETALGESYYQQEKYQKAIDALVNAMPYLEDELKSKAAYLIAESYNYLDNYEKASSYYLRYINWNKGSSRERIAHYGLGWVYYKQEIYHWASDQFSQAASGSDTLARKALYYEGVMNKLGGRYSEALETFQQFGEKYQSGFWLEHAYYEWAITAYEMGAQSEAIEVLLDLLRSDRELKNPDKVYTLLGEAYFANGEYSRAIEAFERAEKLVNIDPSVKRQARFQKAWVQFRNQAYEQAQSIFEQVYQQAGDSDIAAEALFWNADSYYNLANYGQAAQTFEQFVARFPKHEMAGAAYYALGWSYFEMGSYNNAVEPFSIFLNDYDPPSRALFPYNTDTRLRLGDAHYATGNFEEAISYYQQALGAEPGGDYAMYQIANCHYRAGNTYDAVTTFRKLLRIYPYTKLREQAQYNIAYVYFLNNNYEQAVTEFKTVIEKYPNTSWAARAQYSIGDAYYNAGAYKDAIAAYKKVLDEYPNSDYLIDAVNGIQYSQTATGQDDTSNQVLETFLANHPRTGMADRLRYRQAENLMQAGNYKKAVSAFKQYLRVTNSGDMIPAAHYNLGEAYEQLEKPAEAIEEYTIIVENYPESDQSATALSALGRLAYENGRYQASKEYYEQLKGKGSSYREEAYVGMGKAALVQNNIQQAEEHYRKALETEATSFAARMGMAKVEFAKGNLSSAAEQFQKISNENTTLIGAEAQYRLGVTYKQQNQCKKAIEAFSKVEVLYSAFERWVSKSMLEKARCQVSLGRPGDARSTLRGIIDNYGNTEAAREAQRLMKNQTN